MEKGKNKEVQLLLKIVAAGGMAAAAVFLLKRESILLFTWWLLALLMGMVFMPLTGRLFAGFQDKGWMFSKVIGIGLTGFVTWFSVSVKLLKFTTMTCVAVSIVCGILCLLLFLWQNKKGISCYPEEGWNLVFWQEILFFAIFLMWVYIAGFRPETSNSTEKFMDYGFMEAMMRSTTLPPTDMWYSKGRLNYYYGGQYFAVFLTKLTGTRPAVTYNLMRMLVAAFAFVLPFSLVRQLFADKRREQGKGRRGIPVLAGLLSGIAVSIAGNMHYVVYGLAIPLINKIKGITDGAAYWFPDATRYIGHNPDVATDKTIHEFPCYSFILGDLHAHVVNIMFVLAVLGLLYAYHKQIRQELKEQLEKSWKDRCIRELLRPQLLLVSVFLGIFHWTNYWDFVIYFVVAGGVVLFSNMIQFQGKWKEVLGVTALQAVEVILLAIVVILPFTLQFETMVEGVALCWNHTAFYQLCVLWGLPACLVILFLVCQVRRLRGNSLHGWMEAMGGPDLFVMILGLCGLGLVAIPEIVYVQDIYEATSARANTMFKLTYQAYIMFGMCMAYLILRMLVISRKRLVQVLGTAGLICLLLTVGYFGKAVRSWYGNIFQIENYQGQNTTAFLETEHGEDAAAIRWLEANVKGQPVVLEANGDSYSAYNRVSAMTGLPTILGWYVHEWLWRGDVADVNAKSVDVETIYTSQDETQVRTLLEEYEVSYIFLGAKEKEKYGEKLNAALLESLGEVVFRDAVSGTCIIQIKEPSR